MCFNSDLDLEGSLDLEETSRSSELNHNNAIYKILIDHAIMTDPKSIKWNNLIVYAYLGNNFQLMRKLFKTAKEIGDLKYELEYFIT